MWVADQHCVHFGWGKMARLKWRLSVKPKGKLSSQLRQVHRQISLVKLFIPVLPIERACPCLYWDLILGSPLSFPTPVSSFSNPHLTLNISMGLTSLQPGLNFLLLLITSITNTHPYPYLISK